MDFIVFDKVSFSYGSSDNYLIRNFSASLHSGWTGVAGRNGCGKSTLIKLISGDLKPLKGIIKKPSSISLIDQRTENAPESFNNFIFSDDNRAGKLRSILKIDYNWPERWSTLSHGERKRVQCGCALFSNPEVLLLDEPFNHLDHYSVKIIMDAFMEYDGIGIIVSHEREILDSLCGKCIFIDPPDAVLRHGNYTKGKNAIGIEIASAENIRNQKKLKIKKLKRNLNQKKKEVIGSTGKVSKRKVNKKDHDAKAKIDLARLTGKDMKPGQAVKTIETRISREKDSLRNLKINKKYDTGIFFNPSVSKRRFLLHIKEKSISLNESKLLKVPEIYLGSTDRIGITGINGSGKSTFVEREVVKKLTLKKYFYLPQETGSNDSIKILDDINKLSNDEKGELFTIVRRLDSDPKLLISSKLPSPGETRKLLIALGLLKKPELIIMDEPTNHLDIVSIECLEEALKDYNGAIILISHDERFLVNTTIKRIHFADSETGYSIEYLNKPCCGDKDLV